MQRSKTNQGFTIIELLIVVAVISVIATIILINVTTYLDKSSDAATKEKMASIQTNASVYYDANSNYTSFCSNAITVSAFNSIASTKKFCRSDETIWKTCAVLKIPSNGSRAWCVDSTGVKKEINDNQCNNGINLCP